MGTLYPLTRSRARQKHASHMVNEWLTIPMCASCGAVVVSIDRHHDVAGLDHRVGVLALGELQVFGGFVGDRRRDGLSADVDLDVGGGRLSSPR
jgi:hypothetical protein